MEIKVFNYIEKLDGFVVTAEFKQICNHLGLFGWHGTAWMGRYFTLDNNYGEHWFDNWDLRAEKGATGKLLNIGEHDMLLIDPERFINKNDGACHTDIQRKAFWTSVLKSLRVSVDIIIEEARMNSNFEDDLDEHGRTPDLEERIKAIQKKHKQ